MVSTAEHFEESPLKVVKSFWNKLCLKLGAEISPYSIAVFRIIFGALLFYDFTRYVMKGWIYSKYVKPDFLFSYEAFAFVPRLPEIWMYGVWGLFGLSAFALMARLLCMSLARHYCFGNARG